MKVELVAGLKIKRVYCKTIYKERGMKMVKEKNKLLTKNANDLNVNLFEDVQHIIEDGRNNVAVAINTGLTATYWNIGTRIMNDVLDNKEVKKK